MTCHCGHPPHHHHQNVCRTVTVWGPPSPADASAHIEHAGRNTTPCNCGDYQATT